MERTARLVPNAVRNASNSVGGIGLEPTTSAMSTQRSHQLSYPPMTMIIQLQREMSKSMQDMTLDKSQDTAHDMRMLKNTLDRQYKICYSLCKSYHESSCIN